MARPGPCVVSLLSLALVIGWSGAGGARAQGACDAPGARARIEAIDALVARDARRARVWDLAWAAGLGVAAAGQGGLLALDWVPLRDVDHVVRVGLWVGVSKAAVGGAAHLVLPLGLGPGPDAPTDDACADLARAEERLGRAARAERASFWLILAGGLALNLGGFLYLGLAEDDWGEGFGTFALGYPVALVSAYTQPRAAWHAWRSGRVPGVAAAGRGLGDGLTLVVAPAVGPGFAGLRLVGRF